MKTSGVHKRNDTATSGKSTSKAPYIEIAAKRSSSLEKVLGLLSQKIDQENKDEIRAEILKIMHPTDEMFGYDRDIEINEDVLKMIILFKEHDMSDVLQLLLNNNSRLVNSKLVFKLLEEVNTEHQAMIESLVSEIIKSETGIFASHRGMDSSGDIVSLIHLAARQGMAEALGLLLDNKKNLFEKYIELLNKSTELLKKGAALVNQSVELLGGTKKNNYYTFLTNDTDVLKASLDKGALLIYEGCDLLADAAEFMRGVELLKVAADLKATTNPTKCNVLHLAVFSGKIEMVDLLFKHFPKESLADVNMSGNNIFHIADSNGDKSMFDFLYKKLESLMTEEDFHSMIFCKNLLGKTPANPFIAKSDSIQTSSPHPEVKARYQCHVSAFLVIQEGPAL